MNVIQTIGVIVSLLLPFFVGCASHPNHTGISAEEVAGYKESDEATAGKLTSKGNPSGLDFLRDIPSLKPVSLNMSETEFLDILHKQKLDYQRYLTAGQPTYLVKPKVHVSVVFGFREGLCSGIQRLPN